MKAKRLSLFVAVAAVLLGLAVLLPAVLWVNAQAASSSANQQALGTAATSHAVQELSRAFKDAAKRVRPAVVTISSIRKIRPSMRPGPQPPVPEEFREFFGDEFFQRFFEFGTPFRVPEEGFIREGMGSGVVVSRDGYILTNYHVVRDADEVLVKLIDKRELSAKVVGGDAKTDVAVLKIDANDLTPAPLGDSDQVEVGDWVVAIGNPFGLEQTVTVGVVSAKGRANVGIAEYEDFIQTDAAINPGNSGGPLVNLRGEVIGINTAIATRTGSYAGIGFAIPINMAKAVMDSIIKKGKVERGWLGVIIQDLTKDLADSFGYDGTDGVLVSDVDPDGPAAKAGIRSGDIIVEYNGRKIKNKEQLTASVTSTAPGTEVTLRVFRKGRYLSVRVKLGERKAGLRLAFGGHVAEELGLTVRNLTPDLASRLGYDESEHGVVVVEVEPGSLAYRAGIRPGDLIVSIEGERINNVKEFGTALQKHDLSKGVRMLVKSGGFRRYVFLRASK